MLETICTFITLLILPFLFRTDYFKKERRSFRFELELIAMPVSIAVLLGIAEIFNTPRGFPEFHTFIGILITIYMIAFICYGWSIMVKQAGFRFVLVLVYFLINLMLMFWGSLVSFLNIANAWL